MSEEMEIKDLKDFYVYTLTLLVVFNKMTEGFEGFMKYMIKKNPKKAQKILEEMRECMKKRSLK